MEEKKEEGERCREGEKDQMKRKKLRKEGMKEAERIGVKEGR